VRFRGSKAFRSWAPWHRGGHAEIIEAAGDPQADDRVMQVFLALLDAGTIRYQTLSVLTRLAAAVPGEGLKTPARSRAGDIAAHLARMLEEEEPAGWRRRLAQGALTVLAAQPLLLTQAVRLAIALLPTADDAPTEAGPSERQEPDGGPPDRDEPDGGPGPLGDALCELADLLRDRPVLAALTAGRAVAELYSEYRSGPPVPLAPALPAARRLAGRGDQAGAWFALALTRVGGPRSDWADSWRELLRALRDSPHLEVRQDAWDTSVE
jgi:hypothetical protein